MIVWILIAAAVALLVWPAKQPSIPFSIASKPHGAPDYMEAVRCLQVVTRRLDKTQHLNDPERKALDAILLALSAGSAE